MKDSFMVQSPPINADDPTSGQSVTWQDEHKGNKYIARNLEGAPVPTLSVSQTVGRYGPLLLQDNNYLKQIGNFNRKNVPPRQMNAKGQGAYGYFEATKDLSDLTQAHPFSEKGLRTDIFGRFSTGNALGNYDNTNYPHSMSVKMYTSQGNFDILGIHIPVLDARDPFTFIMGERSRQNNPKSGIRNDYNAIWDFNTLRPERLHMEMYRHSRRGFPHTLQSTDYHPISVFKMISAQGKVTYTRYHFKADKPLRFTTKKEALDQGDADPGFQHRDLFNSIARGQFPSWTLLIQTIPEEDIRNYGWKSGHPSWDPFDSTKTWSEKVYPLMPIGRVVFNGNVKNHHNEAEQACFSPGNLIPGIEPAYEDILLMTRIYAYYEAQLYRVGTTFPFLPVNEAKGVDSAGHYERDGKMKYGKNNGAAPNYYPNGFGGPKVNEDAAGRASRQVFSGRIARFSRINSDNVSQPQELYRNGMTEEDREEMIQNLADDIRLTYPYIQIRAIEAFYRIDRDLGRRLHQKLVEAGLSGRGRQRDEEFYYPADFSEFILHPNLNE